jgi:cold shock protein
MNGTVKRWDFDRGFGFISRAAGGGDVFVHVSGLGDGVGELIPGQYVEFDEELDRGRDKYKATNVRLVR